MVRSGEEAVRRVEREAAVTVEVEETINIEEVLRKLINEHC